MNINTNRKVLFYAATGVAVVLVALVLVWERTRAPVRVGYAQVTTGTVQREVLTSGTLEPAKVVDAGAQVSGTIQTLAVDFNSRVKAGQVIARLDPSLYDSRVIGAQGFLSQAEADLAGARVAASDLETKLDRATTLRGQGLITQVELDAASIASREADAAVKSDDAAVLAARAMVNEAELTRDRTVIRAPIDGVVINRAVEVGQTVAASFAAPVLYTIADLRQMRLIAAVDEADVGAVTPGTPVTFEIQSREGKEFEGTVEEVRLQPIDTPGTTTATGTSGAAPTAPTGVAPTGPAGNVVSYEAVIDVPNPDQSLAPGTTAVLMLPTARRANVVRIPNTALTFHPSQDVLDAVRQDAPKLAPAGAGDDPAAGHVAYVWKYEGGRFVPIEVRTGVADDRWTELLSGDIGPGDQLVTQAAPPR